MRIRRAGFFSRIALVLMAALALSAWLRHAQAEVGDDLPPCPPAGADAGPVQGPIPHPVPSQSSILGAEKLLKEVHGPALARTSPADMETLAQTLLAEGTQGENAAEQWVLLREARQRAARAGDAGLAISAAGATAERFDLDPRALMGEVLGALAATTNPTPQAASAEIELARRCFEQSEFELASQAIEAAKATAREAHSHEAIEEVKAAAQPIESALDAYRQASGALLKLQSQPDDPAACAQVGRYECFVLGSWPRGLALLAKESDATLKSLAARELTPPGSPGDWLALADAWAQAAESDPPDAPSIRRHAEDCCRRAIDRLEGLSRLSAQKHLQQLASAHLEPGVVCQMFMGRSFERRLLTRIDPQIAFQWNGQSPAPQVPPECFSARFTGWIKMPSAGEYKIIVNHDDGVRLWVDGKPCIDNWTMGTASDSATLELSANYHDLRLEYEQGEGGSHLTLLWSAPGLSATTPIPADIFFHEPLDIAEQLQTRLEPDPDGTVHLTAAFADPHGSGTRYIDDDGSSASISGLVNLTAYASWDVVVPEGKYVIELTFSCDDDAAGGDFLVTVGPAAFRGKSENTGGWDRPKKYALGAVKLSAGPHRITVRSTTFPKPRALHVNEITLVPKK